MALARFRLPLSASVLCLFISLSALTFAGAAAHAQTGSFPSGAVNLGSVAVNTGTPATATLTFTFASGGTIEAPAVVTQGAKNLDFTDAGTGTCTTNGTSHIYNANDTCTVVVNFAPKYAGTRYGAAVLYDSSDKEIATGYIYGTGTGPQVVFSPPVQINLGGGFQRPQSVAIDATGNVYVADSANSAVYEMPPGCASSTCVTQLGGGFDMPNGVAVDGSGNIYVTEYFDDALEEMPPGCASSACVTAVGGGLIGPWGLAVDGGGNIYVTEYWGTVKEVPAGCTSPACVSALGGGSIGPSLGVAVDGGGNLFVLKGSQLKEVPFGCSSSSCLHSIGGGFKSLAGVAVDGSGNVYVSDSGAKVIEEMPPDCSSAGCVTTLSVNLTRPTGVAIDGRGNVFVSYQNGVFDPYNPSRNDPVVAELNRADPPSLLFAPTIGGKDRLLTVTLQNIGTEPLIFPVLPSSNNPDISDRNFTLDGGVTNACPLVVSGSQSAGTLPTGASCALTVSFAPDSETYGNVSGSLLLTDNMSNTTEPAYATQSIALSGMANAPIGSVEGAVDSSTRSTTVARSHKLHVTGWAADPHDGAPVSKVTVLIDGTAVGNASRGIGRPDVVTALNNFSYYHSGWTFTLPASGLAIGQHKVTAVIDDSLGLSTQLQPRTFVVSESAAYGHPFGSLDGAVDASTRSTTVAQVDNLLVSGWAADIHDGAPVSDVSILIDGDPAGNATLGIASPNVVAHYNNPRYLNSGWTFTMATGSLNPGTHTVSAVASDSLGQSSTLGTKTITIAATPTAGPPFGSLETAVDAATGLTTISQSDNLFVHGWAADVHDGAPVSQVAILIDGTAVGNATLGFARPDVAKHEKNAAYTNSGWKFALSASTLTTGTHTVTAVATDSLGLTRQFRIRVITVTP